MYDKEKTDYNNMKLYGILRGDSVSHKSGYINNFISTCIENLAGAKLLPELEASSPNSPKAKELHPSLISAFNGLYKLQRSTMTYSKDIRERSLSILITTTGDR
ncbi:unnamed protein product [Rotaria magnacalcarata]|uniref:Uncharacterized protein n=1 Tax=Rotaria magnacalcarata TaxID=392030 RepID=A0A820EWG2_9BILA|nr:unnamed protein product [Rotaria magnacalcarata]